MDLRQLNTLLAIADHGSFSAAARALFTVQSNVSGHIARLEKELGATLVDRQRGELTEEGAAVVDRARRIQRELDAISSDMASRGTDAAGDARVGVIGTTGRWLMPPLLTALARSHPRVRTLVAEGSTSSLLPSATSVRTRGCERASAVSSGGMSQRPVVPITPTRASPAASVPTMCSLSKRPRFRGRRPRRFCRRPC